MRNLIQCAVQSVAAVALINSLTGCGSDQFNSSNAEHFSAVVNSFTPNSAAAMANESSKVRACELASANLGFKLLAGETYSANIYPIVQKKCVRCHGGDQTDKQNSTTCGYLEKNIDNVILRLKNMAPADAIKDSEALKAATDPTKLTDDAIRDQISGGMRSAWPMPPVNRNRGQNPAITAEDIATFTAWKDVPNKCIDSDAAADASLPDINAHTDDDSARATATKDFAGLACEDGPSVAPDWPLVDSLVAIPDDSSSAFYDYSTHAFVDGATKMPGDCTIDALIGLLRAIPSAEQALLEYKAYGWRAVQCSLVDGRPRAYLAQLARVPNTLGDNVYGIFLKDIHIEQRP